MSDTLIKIADGARVAMSWRRFIGMSLVYCPTSVVARALTGPRVPQGMLRHWCQNIVRQVEIDIAPEGLERVAGEPSIIVANHASLLDIPVIGSQLRLDYRWVAKRSLFRVPLIGWHLWACGHIAIDRKKGGNLERVQQQVEQVLAQGGSVLFFPEGTRSPDGALRAFKAGAFASAVRAGVPVLPIVADGTEKLLVKGSLRFPQGAHKRVRLRVLPRVPVPPGDDDQARIDALRDEVRRRMVEALDDLRGHPGAAERPTLDD